MASKGVAAGTGRRSHTKSRKGCKTCKARHIRCDETFPGCNNCKKHDVACDYLTAVSPQADLNDNDLSKAILTTPTIQSPDDGQNGYVWQSMQAQRKDSQLSFSPPPLISTQAHLSPTDSHYYHHLDSICDDMSMKGVTELTLWTSSLPRFLNIASTHLPVMNALLSFSANHVAWSTKSAEIRRLSFEYGSHALSGLHDTIASFCKENSDAALAASMILVCQTTDWRSWSSLETGIDSVTAAMAPWKNESMLADIIVSRSSRQARNINLDIRPRDARERANIMIEALGHLLHLQCSLPVGQLEYEWISRLIDYVRRLQTSEAAISPQQQFEHLYTLRKWTYWVPVQLLEQGGNVSILSLLTLIYLYTTTLQIAPLYPDIGHRFFGLAVVEALEKCLWRIEGMSFEVPDFDDRTLDYPRQTLAYYKAQAEGSPSVHVSPVIGGVPDFGLFAGSGGMGNMSPCFTPLQPNYDSRRVSSSSRSSMLEIPTPSYTQHTGFAHNMGQWGAVPSPMFIPQDFLAASQEDTNPPIYNYQVDLPTHDFTGGFVQHEIWT